MEEDGLYAVIRGVIKSAMHIWANSWFTCMRGSGFPCMVLDLHGWFWFCMHGSGFTCMVFDLLAKGSQIYLSFGIYNWRNLLWLNTRDSPFGHEEAKVLKYGWMDGWIMVD